jgi:putative hydrolase of the HAD superfamily
MQHDRRAVVFDLDDTLYPYRRFTVSGFLAVARHLEATCGLDVRLGFAALVRASRGVDRGREIQACLAQHDLDAGLASELTDVLRHHTPRLRLPATSRRTLVTLRRDGWRIGVLTNGQPTIQQRKIEALALADHVDAVLYAAAWGSGVGKPEAEPFAAVARALDVPARRVVFVGDDEQRDIAGAVRAGMVAVRCAVWIRPAEFTAAAVTVDRLSHVPVIARTLLEEASNPHAA